MGNELQDELRSIARLVGCDAAQLLDLCRAACCDETLLDIGLLTNDEARSVIQTLKLFGGDSRREMESWFEREVVA